MLLPAALISVVLFRCRFFLDSCAISPSRPLFSLFDCACPLLIFLQLYRELFRLIFKVDTGVLYDDVQANELRHFCAVTSLVIQFFE